MRQKIGFCQSLGAHTEIDFSQEILSFRFYYGTHRVDFCLAILNSLQIYLKMALQAFFVMCNIYYRCHSCLSLFLAAFPRNMDDVFYFWLLSVLSAVGVLFVSRRKRRRRRIVRQYWVKPWLRRRDLPQQETMMQFYKELLLVSTLYFYLMSVLMYL